jgi:hypothetical protein
MEYEGGEFNIGTTSNTPQSNTRFTFNSHDLRVVGFQLVVVMLIAGISYIGNLHFGMYSPLVYSLAVAIAEALRRYLN